MGIWGFKPLQNDKVLNELGGLRSTNAIRQKLWAGIRGEYTGFSANFEICALILATLGVDPYYLCNIHVQNVIKAIKTKDYESISEKIYEDTGAIISIASINIEERKDLLCIFTDNLKKDIESDQIEPRFDIIGTRNIGQGTINIYKWNSLIDESDEEYYNIQKVYNIAVETIACNFNNVRKPLQIHPEHINWLLDNKSNHRKFREPNSQGLVKWYKSRYIKGSYVTDRANKFGSLMHIVVGLPVIEPIGESWGEIYGKPILETDPNCGLRLGVPFGAALKKNFPKGLRFKRVKGQYVLYSIDYKTEIRDCTDENEAEITIFDAEDIKEMQKYIELTEYKSEKENKKNYANFHALNKIYGKSNKIVGYTITDGKTTRNIDSISIKKAIASGKAIFDNLTLTSDSRLIMK